jgi:hypothetical protein
MFEFLCSMLFLEPITRLRPYLAFSNYFSEMHSGIIRIFKGRTERNGEGVHTRVVVRQFRIIGDLSIATPS